MFYGVGRPAVTTGFRPLLDTETASPEEATPSLPITNGSAQQPDWSQL